MRHDDLVACSSAFPHTVGNLILNSPPGSSFLGPLTGLCNVNDIHELLLQLLQLGCSFLLVPLEQPFLVARPCVRWGLLLLEVFSKKFMGENIASPAKAPPALCRCVCRGGQ